MAQAALVECPTCNLMYDPVRISACPRRADRKRRAGFEVLSRSRAPLEMLSDRGEVEATTLWGDAEITVVPAPAFGAATKRHRELAGPATASSVLTAAYFLVAVLAGAVGYQIALNWALDKPWNEPPVTVLERARLYRVPVRKAVAETGQLVRSGPGAVAAAQPALRVTSLRLGAKPQEGRLYWLGRVTNTSATAIDEVRLVVTALDADGHPVSDQSVILEPSQLTPGEQRSVQARLRDDPAIARVVVGGAWQESRSEGSLYTELKPASLETGAEP